MERSVAQKYKQAFRGDRPDHTQPDEFSVRHPKMPLGQRAKIFSPFAALRGFEEAIDRKRETYVSKIELSEEDQERLNRTLLQLDARMKERRRAGGAPVAVTAVYYLPCGDENHEAYGRRGTYETRTGTVRKLDPLVRKAIQVDETLIELADILELKIEG